MKKTPFLIDLHFPTLSFVVLCILFIPLLTYAGTFYHCIDKAGNNTLSDYPVDGQTCKQIRTHEEMKSARGENKTWRHVESTVTSSGDETTKVIIRGNSVLVPVTLVSGSNEITVDLLLDTGATGTVIYTEIADQLSLNLSDAKKVKVGVVGGGVIEASVIRINSLTVGPHTSRNRYIFIVPHEGSAAKFGGMLGMDVLRELKYKIDFKKQVIIWE
jgi:predicted aspartyl protease